MAEDLGISPMIEAPLEADSASRPIARFKRPVLVLGLCPPTMAPTPSEWQLLICLETQWLAVGVGVSRLGVAEKGWCTVRSLRAVQGPAHGGMAKGVMQESQKKTVVGQLQQHRT